MSSKAHISKQLNVPCDGVRLNPGRHFCHCQARIHGLVRNCLSCGRVTCTQEGSGPCFNCGTLVCSREERQILDENSKRSYELLQRLMYQDTGIAAQRGENTKYFAKLGNSILQANEYKEKLLAADHNKDRTKVTDLESDYYTLEHNSFLSSEDREAIVKRKEELKQLNCENRRKVVMDLDVANKTFTTKKQNSLETAQDPILQSILVNSKQNYVCSSVSDSSMAEALESFKGFVPRYRPELSDAAAFDAFALKDARELLHKKGRDSLHCIALHEPLASLIASAKKSHLPCRREIRHKGTVIIASLKESHCSDLFHCPTPYESTLVSSSKTPSLLGKAIVRDCMTWVEYNDEYPEGECNGISDYFVLILEMQETFPWHVPYSSPSEFYEIDRALKEVIARNMVGEGIFESLDLNSL